MYILGNFKNFFQNKNCYFTQTFNDTVVTGQYNYIDIKKAQIWTFNDPHANNRYAREFSEPRDATLQFVMLTDYVNNELCNE